MNNQNTEKQNHLRVFEDRSEYHAENGHTELFPEGQISSEAKTRIKEIRENFESGFLEELIVSLLKNEITVNIEKISSAAFDSVNILVDSLTSEVGRALIGLSVMQLSIKSINSEQNIRLHKGSANRASFSWVEGVSMRALDKKYVTPTLRKYNLLRLNADGFMMTRSLAENYPYTFLYKANLRGAREQWLTLVEELEKEKTSPIETLKHLISRLINAASDFESEAECLLDSARLIIDRCTDANTVLSILKKHSEVSDYAARLLEISMHSLMQSATDIGTFATSTVKPLSQMRSANKKHGNIGDVELLEEDEIVEAWDAKYGKGYLREEIEEAVEKLKDHDFVKLVGFVTNVEVERATEISNRIDEIKQLYSVEFLVVRYDDWVNRIYKLTLDSELATENELSQKWFMTYCEYLSQKRRDVAPIDEPCQAWVTSLIEIIKRTY